MLNGIQNTPSVEKTLLLDPVAEGPRIKPKKQLTEAQLEALKRGREKLAEKRRMVKDAEDAAPEKLPLSLSELSIPDSQKSSAGPVESPSEAIESTKLNETEYEDIFETESVKSEESNESDDDYQDISPDSSGAPFCAMM